MLIPMKPILKCADKFGYGQGAFNVNAVCQAKAAIEVNLMFRSPVILQGADLANGFMGGRTDFMNATLDDKRKGAANIAKAVKAYGDKLWLPIALHLDHGRDYESCIAAIEGGYTSVMIDGSSLSFDDNVELTREVVKYAHSRGVTVEGELGILAGTEDKISSRTGTYTNPLKAVDFFKKTKVDALAISYGTMHGVNKGKNAALRKEIAIAIKESLLHEGIEGYLVSHGSSTVPQYIVEEINKLGGQVHNAYGINAEQLVEVTHCGINKVNVDTDVRLAVTRNIRELFYNDKNLQTSKSLEPVFMLLEKHKEAFDPRLYLTPLMNTVMFGNVPDSDVEKLCNCIEAGVKEIVGMLSVKFGSVGMAPRVENVSLDEMADYYRKDGI